MSQSPRKPYSGLHRKFIVGIDVGTTFSGVSYSILDPGVSPLIQGVNRYPAQERVGGNAKIPSVIYYDTRGAVRAAGAEALLESNAELAREEQWIKVEWFKLYLLPERMKSLMDRNLPPLPFQKTAEQVFGDFLRYLYGCTGSYIQDTHASGSEIWKSLKKHAEFVLTHPNGWEGAQQAQMREAAVYAGLVPDTPEGHSRITFVTEGEASLHYCIGNGFSSDVIESGEGIIIVDAGGGTIDLSAYYKRNEQSQFEEIAPAMCQFHGSVYVSRRAKAFLQAKLSNSRYDTPEDLDYITDCFDKVTKLSFRDPSQLAYIKFGTSRDTDLSIGVKFGQLRLQGSEVEAFFEPSIAAIEQAVQEQKAEAHIPITKSVLMVGGFAASNWLFSSLQNRLRAEGLHLHRPDGHLGKAVADGAVSFLIDHFVSSRVTRVTFGTTRRVRFDKNNMDHQSRSSTIFVAGDGKKCLSNGFTVLVAKGTSVSETTVVFRRFSIVRTSREDFTSVEDKILVFRGSNPNPQWVDVEPHLYSEACTVTADIRSAVQSLPCLTGKHGKPYFRFDYKIQLLFGLTEYKAQICWQENGEEKRGPATIVYNWGSGNS